MSTPLTFHRNSVNVVQVPLLTSHRMAELSTDPDISWVESGDQQISYTSSICPLSIFSTVQFSLFSVSPSLLANKSGTSDFGFSVHSIMTASMRRIIKSIRVTPYHHENRTTPTIITRSQHFPAGRETDRVDGPLVPLQIRQELDGTDAILPKFNAPDLESNGKVF